MTNDEVVKLVIETTGTTDIQAAIKALEKLAPTMKATGSAAYDLNDAIGDAFDRAFASATASTDRLRDAQGRFVAQGDRVVATTTASADSAKQATDAVDDLADAHQRVTAATAKQAGSTTQAGKGAADYRQQLTALGYAANDFFSVSGDLAARLGAISNNLPMLLGGAGVALSGILPIIGMVIRNWDDLSKAIGAGLDTDGVRKFRDEFKTLEATIKELSEKKTLLAIESHQLDEAQEKLDRLKKGLTEYNAMIGKQAPHEAASGKEVDKAITESEAGPAEIQKQLGDAIEAKDARESRTIQLAKEEVAKATAERLKLEASALAATDPAQQAAMLPFIEAAQKRVKEALEAEATAREGIAKEAKSKAGALIADARDKTGVAQADANEALAKGLEDIGQQSVAYNVRENSPERAKLKAEADERFKFNKENRAEAERKRIAAAEKEGQQAAADLQTDAAHQAELARQRRAGEIDEAGRNRFQKDFDDASAQRARMKQAEADRQRAQQAQPPLPPAPADDNPALLFNQAAGKQYRQQQRFNPNMPALTPEKQAEYGRQLAEHVQASGANPAQQRDIGLLMNDPRASRAIPGAMSALNARGFDDASAMRALPELFRMVKNGVGDIGQAAQRIAEQAARANRDAMAEAAREQHRVPVAVPQGPRADGGFRSVAPSAEPPARVAQQPALPPPAPADETLPAVAAVGAQMAAVGRTTLQNQAALAKSVNGILNQLDQLRVWSGQINLAVNQLSDRATPMRGTFLVSGRG